MAHKIFDYESFPGAAGTDITAIAPTSSDSAAPHWTVTSGTFKADGNGGLLVGGPGNAKGLMPSPTSGQFDATQVASSLPSGSNNLGFFIEQDTATYYAGFEGGNTIVLRKLGGNGSADMANSSYPVTGSPTAPFTFTVQKRVSGSTATLTTILNGTSYPPATDTNPNLGSVASAASIQSTGGSYTLGQFNVTDPAGVTNPTTVTLAGPNPASGTAGSESGGFTATLDQPAPTGGTTVNLASSTSGDTFHATSGGSAVASVTIAAGGTSATFLLVPAAAGSRNVSITSAGLTVAGSPVAYAATGSPVVPANATGYTLAASAASVATGTADTITAALTGGSALASSLVIALADSLGATISGTIVIAPGSTIGTATITPSAVGTHAITGTHTGGGFTGGDGSTSFTATTPASPGTDDTLLAEILALSDLILQATGSITQAINSLPAPWTAALNTAFWAARDAADPTAAEGQFVDFMAQRPSLIAMVDARIALAINGATSGTPVTGSLAANAYTAAYF